MQNQGQIVGCLPGRLLDLAEVGATRFGDSPDAAGEAMLLHSAEGDSIALSELLSAGSCSGIWFDPGTGATRLLTGRDEWSEGTILRKPYAGEWLLLLKAQC